MTTSKQPLFPLGQILSTPGACEALTGEQFAEYLVRHAHGDWGYVSPEDAEENVLAIREGFRILSAFPIDPALPCRGFGENCVWIITEADRSVTTFLLPCEY